MTKRSAGFPGRLWGFSLVELLVVVAVIAILMSLLLPMLTRMRDRAEQIRCTANLQQCYQLLTLYAGDHDRAIPEANSRNPYTLLDRHVEILDRYMKQIGAEPSVWYCPGLLEEMTQISVGLWDTRGAPHYACAPDETNIGYGYIVNPTNASRQKYIKTPVIKRETYFRAETEWMVDVSVAYRPPNAEPNAINIRNWRTFPHHDRTRPAGTNVLRGDGGVFFRPLNEMTYSYRYIHAANFYW